MAETELQGTIKLNADTQAAESEVRRFSAREGRSAGRRFGASFGDDVGKQVTQKLRGAMGRLGPVGRMASGGLSAVAGSGLAIAGTTAALAALPVAAAGAAMGLNALAESAQNSNRQLSQASPAMAATMNLFDVRMRLLNMRIGNEVAPSARRLNEAMLGLRRDTAEVSIAMRTAMNALATGAAGFLRDVVDVGSRFTNWIGEVTGRDFSADRVIEGLQQPRIIFPDIAGRQAAEGAAGRPGGVVEDAIRLFPQVDSTLSGFDAVLDRVMGRAAAPSVDVMRGRETARLEQVMENANLFLEDIRDDVRRISREEMANIAEHNNAVLGIMGNIRDQQQGGAEQRRDGVRFDDIVKRRDEATAKAEAKLREFEKEMREHRDRD